MKGPGAQSDCRGTEKENKEKNNRHKGKRRENTP